MVVLLFKKIPRDADGKVFLYSCDYLDMKFTVTENKFRDHIKIYSGWKQDNGSYMHLDDFIKNRHMHRPIRQLRKKVPTAEEKVEEQIVTMCNYIKHIYGFESVTFQIEDFMNLIIEDWLMET